MREIDWDKQLSKEDAEWIEASGSIDLQNKLRENRAKFGAPEGSEEDQLDDLPETLDPDDEAVQVPQAVSHPRPGGPVAEPFDRLSADEQRARLSAGDALAGSDTGDDDFDDNYDEWKVAELKAEADSREPKVDYESNARKPQLVEALRSWDKTYGEGQSTEDTEQ